MALAPAHLSAWQARSLGLVSTSGRHASPLTPLQPATTRAATGGGSSSGSRRGLLSPGTAVGYGSRAAVSAAAGQPVVSSRPYSMPPGSLIGRPPSAPPTQLQQLQRAATAAPAPPAHTQVQAGQAGQHAQQQQQQAGSDDDVAPPAASRIHLPSERELERRKKISKANKGRRPWNVGKKHSPDTIARIKAATRQAMQRPEVRQRLAEANERREPHTDAAKVRRSRTGGRPTRDCGAEQAAPACSTVTPPAHIAASPAIAAPRRPPLTPPLPCPPRTRRPRFASSCWSGPGWHGR